MIDVAEQSSVEKEEKPISFNTWKYDYAVILIRKHVSSNISINSVIMKCHKRTCLYSNSK